MQPAGVSSQHAHSCDSKRDVSANRLRMGVTPTVSISSELLSFLSPKGSTGRKTEVLRLLQLQPDGRGCDRSLLWAQAETPKTDLRGSHQATWQDLQYPTCHPELWAPWKLWVGFKTQRCPGRGHLKFDHTWPVNPSYSAPAKAMANFIHTAFIVSKVNQNNLSSKKLKRVEVVNVGWISQETDSEVGICA